MLYFKNIRVFILGFLLAVVINNLAKLAYAQEITPAVFSYDNLPLNTKSWKEIDLFYFSYINGHQYKNYIKLLRPIRYLKKYHLNHLGNQLHTNLPEIDLKNQPITVFAIKNAPNFKVCYQQNCSYVIGFFAHYTTNVRVYRFQDLSTKQISVLHATPNHPFYVTNLKTYLPINQVSQYDQLLGYKNHTIKLLCPNHQVKHCGMLDSKYTKPVMVYNLEVYQKHNYRVGHDQILVHNGCDEPTIEETQKDPLEVEVERIPVKRKNKSASKMTITRTRTVGTLTNDLTANMVKKYEPFLTFVEGDATPMTVESIKGNRTALKNLYKATTEYGQSEKIKLFNQSGISDSFMDGMIKSRLDNMPHYIGIRTAFLEQKIMEVRDFSDKQELFTLLRSSFITNIEDIQKNYLFFTSPVARFKTIFLRYANF